MYAAGTSGEAVINPFIKAIEDKSGRIQKISIEVIWYWIK